MANTLKFGNGEWYGKKDTILAYNDENNNYKPLPFDFSRGSNATVVNKDGLIETVGSGEPRIDFQGNTKGALLLEPSSTNYVTSSESMTPFFATDGTTLTQNYGVSPNGKNNSVLLTQNSGSVNQSIYNFGLPTTNGDYSYSFFFRAGTSTNVRFYVANAKSENFNPQTVTAGIVNGVNLNLLFEDYGNGWFRVSTTVTLSGASFNRFLIYPDRDNLGRNIEIFGAQYEIGSYATSYIPTSGSAVTRVADSTSQTVPDGVIGQTEGTIYFEFEDLDYSYTSIARAVSLSDGTSTNRIYIAQLSSGAMYAITTGGCEIQETAPSGRRNNLKVAFGYKNNDCVLYVNGVLAGVDNSATTPICSKVHLGNFNNTANLNKPYKEVKLYNTRLSNTELQALTTI